MIAAQAMSKEDREEIVIAFCAASGREEMCIRTMRVLACYAREHGLDHVKEWIEISGDRLPGYTRDGDRGRYISGIRRIWLEDQEKLAQEMMGGAGI